MKKHLFIHIGRPKVGSTALQHFLWQNRQKLAQQGFLYPQSSMHHRASHKLALIFQPGLPDHKIVEGQAPEEIYAALFAEADAKDMKRIIVSSENFFLIDPELVKKQIPENYDVRIVCYVRRQDDVLVSSFLQELKTGAIGLDTDIEEYAALPERLRWLDYEAVLDRWAKQFGRGNVVVRVFEPEQLNGSIQDDLLAIIGADAANLSIPKMRVNPSASRDVLDYIRMINDAPELPRAHKHLLRAPLLEVSERLGNSGPYNAKALVASSVRQNILDRFRRSNASVAKKYLRRRDGVLFFNENIQDDNFDASYTGLDLERFAHMTASLFAAQQQQILQLTRQLRELKHNAHK